MLIHEIKCLLYSLIVFIDAQLFPSYEGCKEAVNNMKKEKSPGLDCLPSEFYQCFWDDIGPFFDKAIQDSFYKGEPS